MRWYVSRHGDTAGPVEEQQVVSWIKSGMTDALVREETSEAWTPLHGSPFATLLWPAPDERIGRVLIAIPAFGALILIASMLLIHNEDDLFTTLGVTNLLVVLSTTILVGKESSLLRMGVVRDTRGRTGTKSTSWVIAMMLFCTIVYPLYMCERGFYGCKNLLLPGFAVALLFWGTLFWIPFARGLEQAP
jgi:hypothetical protein